EGLHGHDRRRHHARPWLRPSGRRIAAHVPQLLRPRRARHGLPVGIGTKIGRPDRPAVILHGDGGFLYVATEINTAVRHKIPHVTVIFNNSCHGSEKAQQMRQWNKKYVGVDLENPRFDKLAEVLAGRGYYVTRPDEIADAFKSALDSNQPAVIEIPVTPFFA